MELWCRVAREWYRFLWKQKSFMQTIPSAVEKHNRSCLEFYLTFHEGCISPAVVVQVRAMDICQAVIPQLRSVAQTLQDGVHEALEIINRDIKWRTRQSWWQQCRAGNNRNMHLLCCPGSSVPPGLGCSCSIQRERGDFQFLVLLLGELTHNNTYRYHAAWIKGPAKPFQKLLRWVIESMNASSEFMVRHTDEPDWEIFVIHVSLAWFKWQI